MAQYLSLDFCFLWTTVSWWEARGRGAQEEVRKSSRSLLIHLSLDAKFRPCSMALLTSFSLMNTTWTNNSNNEGDDKDDDDKDNNNGHNDKEEEEEA